MSYAQNKSLIEYGELDSIHHSDAQAEQEAGKRQHELDNQPAFLAARLLLGGSYVIEWSRGDAAVPPECQGLWTGTTQADNAIKRCMARLVSEAAAAAEAELEADFEAAAVKVEPEKEVITAKPKARRTSKPKTTKE